MWEIEINIPVWQLYLFVYLLFGLAPTMTLLTGLVVGFLQGRADLGLGWGLGTALISSPAGLVTFILTAPALRDQEADLWNSLLYGVVPYVITGLVFSCIAATIIKKRAGGRK